MTAPLLVELFTEELPPRALHKLATAFSGSIAAQLQAHGLIGAQHAQPAQVHCTPRRLAVVLPQVLATAPARKLQLKGPSVAVALDAQGQPTMALKKWAEKQGAAIAALTRASDGKQECFYYHPVADGLALADVIQPVLEQALNALPTPRLMNYQLADGVTTVSFVRPAHRLTVLHGEQVLPCRVLGLAADRVTQGHRFQSSGTIRIESATSYERQLRDAGHVVSSFAARRSLIADALMARSSELGASMAVTPTDEAQVEALLDEVTALVEWPAVYVGRFEDVYLEVPQECLILTMRTNQKYFPLFDPEGGLLSSFLIVSNTAIEDPCAIIDGNERVVRPRLADARFFFDQDRKTRLADRVERLGDVVYHAGLGSQADRSQRVCALAGQVAQLLGQDPAAVKRAALLAKADLLTGMVGEFPELQGIMGRYYARHDGEPPAVAQAIAEQYLPRFAGDALAESPAGTCLALADKLETLAGIWGIGQRPTGEKDPFALRRQALGVVRMLVEQSLPLELSGLIEHACRPLLALPRFDCDVSGLHAFICERLRGYLRDRGFEAADIEAALAVDAQRLDRIENRLVALAEFRRLPEFEALAAANKRIANILRKSQQLEQPEQPEQPEPDGADGTQVRRDLLAEPAEAALFEALLAVRPVVHSHLAQLDFTQALEALAGLRAPVDAFFDKVMVNAPQPHLKVNRLVLLRELRHLMNRVADLSQL
ncbi:MAG: glycine--tRNA ligase subunit beta [Lautropia sp.]|nr:glycine--tRNA ligase subunit beta [Lautropia sp.]